MADFVIRPVTRSDAPQIGRLWTALVAYHTALDATLPLPAADGERRYADRVVQRLNDPYTRVLVAEAGGLLVGYVMGVIVDLMPDIFEQEPVGFIADIFVDGAYRRHGVGRQLVNEITDWFREHDVQAFDWHVAARNQEGQAFWEAVGGRPVMIRMRATIQGGDSD